MSAQTETIRRLTVADITRMHANGERIAMLTAYDFPTARLLDEAGIPMLLVGDSLGTNMLGYDNEMRVTMADMLHHAAAVTRGARRALVVGDMPFLAYATPGEAVDNAGRMLREAGVGAVKLEGGRRSARVIEAVTGAGIAVQGHIGWTPQSQTGMGGKVRVQGKTREAARSLLADALAVQEAGAFSIVLELVPEQLASEITSRLQIPTIGIGAGAGCSGQVQVINDVIGLGTFKPRHARHYAEIGDTIQGAVSAWAADVAAGSFPSPAETVRMDDATLDEALGKTPDDRPDGAPIVSGIPLDRDL
jgi:3-methyl-2-oxobutanoate hydroxymethyltransferase